MGREHGQGLGQGRRSRSRKTAAGTRLGTAHGTGDGSGRNKRTERAFPFGPSLPSRFSSAMPTLGSTACTGVQPGRAGLHGIPLGPTGPASYPRATPAPAGGIYSRGKTGTRLLLPGRAHTTLPATTVPGVSKIPGSSFCPYFQACQRCRAYHCRCMVDGLRWRCCQSVNSRFPRRSGLRSGRGYTPRGPRKRSFPGRRSTA